MIRLFFNLILLPILLFLFFYLRNILFDPLLPIPFIGDIIKAGIEDSFIGTYLFMLIYLTIIGMWVPFFTNNQRILSFTGYLPSLLPALGLIGTFLGIFAGLSNFDPGNIDNSLPILLAGLKVAFTTSILGMVGSAFVKITSFFHPDVSVKDEITENDFFKLFSEQRKSLSEINVGIKALEIKFEEFANKIGESTVEQLIKAIEQVIRDFNTKIEEQFGENFKKFNLGLEKLLEWQNNYIIEVENTKKAIDASNNLLKKHEQSVDTIYQRLDDIPKTLKPLETILETIKKEREEIEKSLESLQNLRKNAEESIPLLSEKISALSNTLSENITNVSKRMEQLDEDMGAELQKSLELLGAHLGSLSEQLVKDYQPLVNDLRNLIEISSNVKKMKFLGKKNIESDSSIWLSNSDLMAGLMIIFLFIAVGFIREKAPEIVGQQEYIMNYLSFQETQEEKIIDALEKEFTKEEKSHWNLEIIPEEKLIRFNAPDIMFKLNDDQLTDRYKKIINLFFPRYIRTLAGFGSLIEEIRIEGHTSSEWEGIDSNNAYFKNMILSQKRTISVLNQAFNSIIESSVTVKEREWAFNKVSASGLSSRKVILNVDGTENASKSRRVEFRYILAEENKIKFIKENIKNNINGN